MSSQQIPTPRDADNDAASVATTSSLTSHTSLLKDKQSSAATSSSSKSEKGQKQKGEKELNKEVLRNQIRMGI